MSWFTKVGLFLQGLVVDDVKPRVSTTTSSPRPRPVLRVVRGGLDAPTVFDQLVNLMAGVPAPRAVNDHARISVADACRALGLSALGDDALEASVRRLVLAMGRWRADRDGARSEINAAAQRLGVDVFALRALDAALSGALGDETAHLEAPRLRVSR